MKVLFSIGLTVAMLWAGSVELIPQRENPGSQPAALQEEVFQVAAFDGQNADGSCDRFPGSGFVDEDGDGICDRYSDGRCSTGTENQRPGRGGQHRRMGRPHHS